MARKKKILWEILNENSFWARLRRRLAKIGGLAYFTIGYVLGICTAILAGFVLFYKL